MAGISGVLTVSITHPIDLIKTRLQISGNPNQKTKTYKGFGSLKIIFQESGMKSFYKGIQAAWLREAFYTSARIGLFEHIQKLFV